MSTSAPVKPMQQSHPLVDVAHQNLALVYGEWPDTVFVDGCGCELISDRGERFLDMTSGIAVTALGHRSRVVEDALKRAAEGLTHTSNLYLTPPAVELARALVERSFADRAFFCNSGAEANEAMIKFARLAAGEERTKVIYFDHSFHGRTFGALSATDKEAIKTPFAPLVPGIEKCRFGDTTDFAKIDEQTACVLIEPVQGEGGVRPAEKAWMQALRRRCDEVGALLAVDEVQCGLGRTGKLFAHEHFDITPDLMALAKPMAGGLPIGAVLMTEAIADQLHPGCHGTTFGGGPVVTAVALAVLNEVGKPAFLESVARKGEHLRSRLAEIQSPLIEEVRGMGLMLGVRVNIDPKLVMKTAWNHRLLVTTAGADVVRFLPPLNATEEDLKDAVERFATTLAELE